MHKKLNENISILTRSFLYQLSHGQDTKFGRFINKLLGQEPDNMHKTFGFHTY